MRLALHLIRRKFLDEELGVIRSLQKLERKGFIDLYERQRAFLRAFLYEPEIRTNLSNVT